MARKRLITSESVTEGHPDKLCDQISDAILDGALKQDPMSRVAIECLTTKGCVMVAGEMTTDGYVDIERIARDTLREIGYTNPKFGIDYEDAAVWLAIHGQSQDISLGVTETSQHEQGAGDQGMMYGFACDETPELMPLPIILAHQLTKRLAQVRKDGTIDYIGPDGKSQVTVEYENGKPQRLETVVVSSQHLESIRGKTITHDQILDAIRREVITPVCDGPYLDGHTNILVNPTGRFVIGGPEGDTGVTGRKIIVDTYGGIGRHGGGAFSGKDPTKVDRSAAYMARYIAKNIVSAGLATICEVQLSYAIGVAHPTSVDVDCLGTNVIPEEDLSMLVRRNFPLTPKGIIDYLDLRRPIYQKTAAYGHFGRDDPDFTWESTDKAEILKRQARI